MADEAPKNYRTQSELYAAASAAAAAVRKLKTPKQDNAKT